MGKWFRLFREGWESGDESKLAAAEAHYRRVVAEEPTTVDAWHILAGIEQARGRFERALPLIETALELQPSAAALHQTAGDLSRAMGEHPRALSAYERAVELRPGYFKGHLHLGCTLLDMEEEGQALSSLERAAELAPSDAACWFYLGRSLVALGRLREGESCFERILGQDPGNGPARVEIARIRMRQQRLPAALELLEGVLADLGDDCAGSNGADAGLRRLAGELELDVHHSLAECGESERSLAGYRAAIARDPGNVRAWLNLSNKFGSQLDEDELEALRGLAHRDGHSDEQRAGLHYGLVVVYDHRGERARAVEHARHANSSFAASVRSRGKADGRREYGGIVDFHVELFSAEHFARHGSAGVASERPVFIVGMPRSGTSLVEQILASHPEVFGGGELMYIGDGIKLSVAEAGGRRSWRQRVRDGDRPLIENAARRYLTQLSELNPSAARVTDKLPDNHLHLGWISTMFPGARIIHCMRDTRDVALSCWMNSLVNLAWSASLEAIRERIGHYRRLMEHWSAVLICHLRYEELTSDLEGSARRMIDYCDLPWDNRCLEFDTTRRVVKTASHQQVREPVHRHSVRRWEEYAEILGPALSDLEG